MQPDTRTYQFTLFPNQFAREKLHLECTLAEMAANITDTTADGKEALPWLKMALVGNKPSEKGCLRTNANTEALTGVELDYDGGGISFEDATGWLEIYGVTSLVYTTPSYTVEKPRWRVLCPLSRPWVEGTTTELQELRNTLCSRVNGIFDGGFASESWTLSQSYYFGNVSGREPVRVHVYHGDYIDRRDDLPVIGKPNAIGEATAPRRTTPHPNDGKPISAEQMLEMARAAAIASRDLHYPDLLRVIMSVARTSVIGRTDDAVQREAAEIIWTANTASETAANDEDNSKFESVFTAAAPTSGSAITPATFFKFAKDGGWKLPLGATYPAFKLPQPRLRSGICQSR